MRSGWFTGRDLLMVVAGGVLGLAVLSGWTIWMPDGGDDEQVDAVPEAAPSETSDDEVRLPRDVLGVAGIESVEATSAQATERLYTTGVVEPDQQQIQQVTPLVTGRVERVYVALGDQVQAGSALLTLSSPQVAALLGDLRAAEAAVADQEATFARVTRLVELGAGAGKDLVAAESGYHTAQARVVQLRQSLEVLGVSVADESPPETLTSTIFIRAPIAGTVIDRAVNPGGWIDAGTSVLTLANLQKVWLIVHVPEARLNIARPGAAVEIRPPAQDSVLTGQVAYVDPQLDRATRTARARVEVANPLEALKFGMFVDVTIDGPSDPGAVEVTVPSDAIQRLGERSIVFMPTSEPERFEIRDVELGDEVRGSRVIRTGLVSGDRVVTRGGFTLKSQLLRGQFGEDEELADR